MPGVDLDTFRALRSPSGVALLGDIGTYDEADVLAQGALLRSRHAPGLVAAAMTQARLRARAAAKLGPDAASMWFTATGLEQATRAEVSRRRAGRVAASGAQVVADLGCGIGADMLALARAGMQVRAVERDPLTAAVALANAEALGLAHRVSVTVADVTDTAATSAVLTGADVAFTDPARRGGRGRAHAPEAWSPPWSWVTALAGQVPGVVAKVAPGIAHGVLPADVEAEWVSCSGDVVEAAAWFGRLASGVRRRATLLPGPHVLTDAGLSTPPVQAPGTWLYEPDGAVIRAGLVGHVAQAVGGWLLDPTIAYVSADRHAVTPYATAFEVTDVMPFQLKRLRTVLRERGVGRVEVKKRGSPIEPEALRRALRLEGSGEAVVVLTRVAGAPTVLLARRPAA